MNEKIDKRMSRKSTKKKPAISSMNGNRSFAVLEKDGRKIDKRIQVKNKHHRTLTVVLPLLRSRGHLAKYLPHAPRP